MVRVCLDLGLRPSRGPLMVRVCLDLGASSGSVDGGMLLWCRQQWRTISLATAAALVMVVLGEFPDCIQVKNVFSGQVA